MNAKDLELSNVQRLVDGMSEDNRQQISDGSHTFDELYFHRMTLFSMICKIYPEKSWKSKLHADGTMYPNYFIVGISTPEGDYSYHYHMEHWDRFDIEELEKAPEWDGHEPKDIGRLYSLLETRVDPWLQKELDIACKNEDAYGKAIYNSAAKAYMSMCGDGHTRFTIGIAKAIFERLINRKPLKSLTGDDSEWIRCADLDGTDYESWQNNRCSSVFKYVYNDGRVEYSDVDQFIFVNVDNDKDRFSSGYLTAKMREIRPITMPYAPRTWPIEVYVEEFLVDRSKGDYDTQGLLYFMEGPKKIEINKFFNEREGHKWEEISKEEYLDLRSRRIN